MSSLLLITCFGNGIGVMNKKRDTDVCRCRYAHSVDWEGRCSYCEKYMSRADLEKHNKGLSE